MSLRCLLRHRWVVDSFSTGRITSMTWCPSVCLVCKVCGRKKHRGRSILTDLPTRAAALCWVKAQGEFNPGEAAAIARMAKR